VFDEDETQHQKTPAMAEATTRIIHEPVEKYTKELKNRKAPRIEQRTDKVTDWKRSITLSLSSKKEPKNNQETTEE